MRRTTPPLSLSFLLLFAGALLQGCGGSSGPWHGNDGDGNSAPGAPSSLAGNAGDTAVSIGWTAPSSGLAPFSYDIAISPSAGGAQTTMSGNGALVTGLANGTTYTFSVRAKNNAGQSTAATVQLRPTANDTSQYVALAVSGNSDGNSDSGIADPAPLRDVSGRVWLAYASVDYYTQSSVRYQDSSVSVARSSDGGQSFSYVRSVGNATAASVTATSVSPCGNATCSGRWIYDNPFMVEDSGDADPARRFKLFARKYFLYPGATPTQFPALGSIVMWTATAPDATWSAEQSLLGWDLTPPELTPSRNINTFDPSLSDCLSFGEGSAAVFNGSLDFVFACDTGLAQRIVLLRSSDHGNSFKYVATLLDTSDAATYGALYFSAPALLPGAGAAPLLIATPVLNRSVNGSAVDAYSGCVAFPIADQETGALFRNGAQPRSILQVPLIADRVNGACGWERGLGSGLLMNEIDTSLQQFRILNTAKKF